MSTQGLSQPRPSLALVAAGAEPKDCFARASQQWGGCEGCQAVVTNPAACLTGAQGTQTSSKAMGRAGTLQSKLMWLCPPVPGARGLSGVGAWCVS